MVSVNPSFSLHTPTPGSTHPAPWASSRSTSRGAQPSRRNARSCPARRGPGPTRSTPQGRLPDDRSARPWTSKRDRLRTVTSTPVPSPAELSRARAGAAAQPPPTPNATTTAARFHITAASLTPNASLAFFVGFRRGASVAAVREQPPAARRALPPAHEILAAAEALQLIEQRGRPAVTAALRAVLDALRSELLAGALPPERDALRAEAVARLHLQVRSSDPPGLQRVINAAGVVLHTNLGRAPLGAVALAAITEACRGYAAVEYDLARGARGHRDALLAPLANAVLGGDDALVVNNCAAAVLLAATALAAGREVIVSRGELVEIGGGFRVPDVIASCGARLVEVGTTNKTRAADYARAIGPDTGAILVVHRSNFALVGFTEQSPLEELAALARARGVPLLVDLGSGAGGDTRALGLTTREPLSRECVASGADLVMVSGDKLLGGPQAGVVVGGAAWVARLRGHPLMRALRPGRLVMAALEATLRAHADGRAARDVPAVALLARTPAELRGAAEALLAAIAAGGLPDGVRVSLAPTEARVGGGTLPLEALPSWAVRVDGVAPDPLAAALRAGSPPVVGRGLDGALHLDVRSVLPWEVHDLAAAVTAAAHKAVATGARPDQATRA